jgi:hypothetical protein
MTDVSQLNDVTDDHKPSDTRNHRVARSSLVQAPFPRQADQFCLASQHYDFNNLVP